MARAQRWIFFVYGVLCHALFLGTFAWLAAFVGGLPAGKTIDSPPSSDVAIALGIDLALILLFGLQHSVMARPRFKEWWTRLVPAPIERSTYVLLSCLVTFLLIWQWRAIDIVVWDVQEPLGRRVLWALFAGGWLLIPIASLMIDHFDLFGTRQVWLHLRGLPYRPLPFRVPALYRHVRHPLYVGWALAFWATPTMTLGHLLFATAMTAYMVIASRVEERELVALFGRRYEDYRARVPAFVPRLGRAAVASAIDARRTEQR